MSHTYNLNNSMRQLRKEGKHSVTEAELREKSGLKKIPFTSALEEAIHLQFLERSADGKIQEGLRLKEQPDKDEMEKLPLYKFSPGTQPLWERILLAVLGFGLIVFLIYLIVNQTEYSENNWKLARLLASLLAAIVGVFLTGMLEVRHERKATLERPGFYIRATGALAMFAIVFWAL